MRHAEARLDFIGGRVQEPAGKEGMDNGTDAGRPMTGAEVSVPLGTGPLLVGVDWSEGSRHALEWTALIARNSESPVTLIHAIAPWDGLQAVPSSDIERYRSMVTGSADRWGRFLDGLRHDSRVVEGDPALSIRIVADEISPSLIVVGNHGAGRFSSTLLGSVATKVLHTSRVPVAVVPRSARVGAIHGDLVVGVDRSVSSRRAIDWAAQAGIVLGVGAYLVSTYPVDTHVERPTLSDSGDDGSVEGALEVLRELASEVAEETGTRVNSDVLIGEPTSRLLEAASGDLALVLGSTGQSSPPDAKLGSTGRYAATHASVPVIIVP